MIVVIDWLLLNQITRNFQKVRFKKVDTVLPNGIWHVKVYNEPVIFFYKEYHLQIMVTKSYKASCDDDRTRFANTTNFLEQTHIVGLNRLSKKHQSVIKMAKSVE